MIALPTISEIIKVTQSLATLDLIIESDWEYRYYSFNSKWSADEQMASMRNGSGDEWYIVFHAKGWAALKGLAHESAAASVKGLSETLQKAVPEEYKSFANEPSFGWDATTFCFWCENDDSTWQSPPTMQEQDTGADELLDPLVSGPKGYHRFAQKYYERKIDLGAVEQVFQHQAIDAQMVSALNSKVTIDDINEELAEIGYPKQ